VPGERKGLKGGKRIVEGRGREGVSGIWGQFFQGPALRSKKQVEGKSFSLN